MSETPHYYLVDLENVGLQGLCGLTLLGEGDEITIFLSHAAHVGTAEIEKDILESKAIVRTVFCSAKAKNALDFQLSAYFGTVLVRDDTKRISIISNDTGYRALDDYAKKTRGKVVVYFGRSVVEAYVAGQNLLSPRLYKKGKPIDFKAIMKKKENPLSGICDDDEIRAITPLLTDNLPMHKVYIGLLKILGRDKGLTVYRLVKNGQVNAFLID